VGLKGKDDGRWSHRDPPLSLFTLLKASSRKIEPTFSVAAIKKMIIVRCSGDGNISEVSVLQVKRYFLNKDLVREVYSKRETGISSPGQSE